MKKDSEDTTNPKEATIMPGITADWRDAMLNRNGIIKEFPNPRKI